MRRLFLCSVLLALGCGGSDGDTTAGPGPGDAKGDSASDGATDSSATDSTTEDSGTTDSGGADSTTDSGASDTPITKDTGAIKDTDKPPPDTDPPPPPPTDAGDKCATVKCAAPLVCCPATGTCYDPKCLACCPSKI